MKCTVCGKRGPEDGPTSLDANGWDWFTGYLSKVAYFCPTHSRSEARQKLFDLSQKEPTNWAEKRKLEAALRNRRKPK